MRTRNHRLLFIAAACALLLVPAVTAARGNGPRRNTVPLRPPAKRAHLLPPPTPDWPADGATLHTQSPWLSVVPLPEADWYYFQVFQDTTLRAEGGTGGVQWTVSPALDYYQSYTWRCRAHNHLGWSPYFSPDRTFTLAPDSGGHAVEEPQTLGLLSAVLSVRPNPVSRRASCVVVLETPHALDADLALYDAQGRLVHRIFSGPLPAGRRVLRLDGRTMVACRAGIYLVRLCTGADVLTRLLIITD
jgi:hypothetical protein